ncbi:hypothetical protein AG0111_0g8543 [Alternaria gaisen]|uniref:Uncharacterized protein n=1 Tax=Alternaria gaisen TaxID=167740 RepID=A0ACB6FGV2_9PLEO|nr:hypothetical protein AG0111_0g8543 [Alternaria gaisen]
MSAVAPSNAFLSSIPTWAYDFAPNGSIAETTVAAIKNSGRNLTLADLANYNIL